jgi:hypothetical protein
VKLLDRVQEGQQRAERREGEQIGLRSEAEVRGRQGEPGGRARGPAASPVAAARGTSAARARPSARAKAAVAQDSPPGPSAAWTAKSRRFAAGSTQFQGPSAVCEKGSVVGIAPVVQIHSPVRIRHHTSGSRTLVIPLAAAASGSAAHGSQRGAPPPAAVPGVRASGDAASAPVTLTDPTRRSAGP